MQRILMNNWSLILVYSIVLIMMILPKLGYIGNYVENFPTSFLSSVEEICYAITPHRPWYEDTTHDASVLSLEQLQMIALWRKHPLVQDKIGAYRVFRKIANKYEKSGDTKSSEFAIAHYNIASLKTDCSLLRYWNVSNAEESSGLVSDKNIADIDTHYRIAINTISSAGLEDDYLEIFRDSYSGSMEYLKQIKEHNQYKKFLASDTNKYLQRAKALYEESLLRGEYSDLPFVAEVMLSTLRDVDRSAIGYNNWEFAFIADACQDAGDYLMIHERYFEAADLLKKALDTRVILGQVPSGPSSNLDQIACHISYARALEKVGAAGESRRVLKVVERIIPLYRYDNRYHEKYRYGFWLRARTLAALDAVNPKVEVRDSLNNVYDFYPKELLAKTHLWEIGYNAALRKPADSSEQKHLYLIVRSKLNYVVNSRDSLNLASLLPDS